MFQNEFSLKMYNAYVQTDFDFVKTSLAIQ